MTKATLDEQERVRVQKAVNQKVQMSRRTKSNGALTRYERVANLAQELNREPIRPYLLDELSEFSAK